MKFRLNRTECGVTGQFGELVDDQDTAVFQTAEHAYDDGTGCYTPKIPPGTYTCVLGTHALHDGVPFQTYEITGVAGHAGLLLHAGNRPQVDSSGCVLLGFSHGEIDRCPAVMDSKKAFAAFLALTNGAPTIELEVVG